MNDMEKNRLKITRKRNSNGTLLYIRSSSSTSLPPYHRIHNNMCVFRSFIVHCEFVNIRRCISLNLYFLRSISTMLTRLFNMLVSRHTHTPIYASTYCNYTQIEVNSFCICVRGRAYRGANMRHTPT